MGMRHNGDTTPNRAPKATTSGQQRVTSAPAQPWHTHHEVWLLACLALPPGLRYGYTLDPATRTPQAASLSAPDGSWCDIELNPGKGGSRQLREAGPTPLWVHVEHADRLWHQHNQPGWQRFGLTITETHQRVWLDEPHNVLHQLTETGSLR